MAAVASSSSVDPARLVRLDEEKVRDVSSPFFPHHYSSTAGGSSSLRDDASLPWSLDTFRRSLVCKVTRLSSERIEFDLIGVDASVANALRRIMISEVPTAAIEDVYIMNNTSIVQDEVLSHRLGLVPIRADPDLLHWKGNGASSPNNTLVFTLQEKCERNPAHRRRTMVKRQGVNGSSSMQVDGEDEEEEETDPEKLYINANTYSGQLRFHPHAEQQDWNWKTTNNPSGNEPRPVHDKILLAKLRPGQEIRLEAHCILGIGKDHAKFSPVATASYRLLPHIDILEPIGEGSTSKEEREKEQHDFTKCFPEGVIGLRPKSGADSGKGRKGEMEVYVKDPRRDTVSREVLRDERFKNKVKLGRVRDHFLCECAQRLVARWLLI